MGASYLPRCGGTDAKSSRSLGRRSTLVTPTFARILVPTDVSTHSEAALGYATALAEESGSSLELLHVLEDLFMPGTGSAEV
jgi:hypothetical protein